MRDLEVALFDLEIVDHRRIEDFFREEFTQIGLFHRLIVDEHDLWRTAHNEILKAVFDDATGDRCGLARHFVAIQWLESDKPNARFLFPRLDLFEDGIDESVVRQRKVEAPSPELPVFWEEALHFSSFERLEPHKPPDPLAALGDFGPGVRRLKRSVVLVVEADPVVHDEEILDRFRWRRTFTLRLLEEAWKGRSLDCDLDLTFCGLPVL